MQLEKSNFIRAAQARTARVAVGASTVREQGAGTDVFIHITESLMSYDHSGV